MKWLGNKHPGVLEEHQKDRSNTDLLVSGSKLLSKRPFMKVEDEDEQSLFCTPVNSIAVLPCYVSVQTVALLIFRGVIVSSEGH